MKQLTINQRYFNSVWILAFAVLVTMSCEDVIEVDLEDGGTQLVVDGWISDVDAPQTIKLTLSQQYFENATPPPVTDAEVTLTRQDGEVFEFLHSSEGNYIWTPTDGGLGITDDVFTLNIEYNNVTFSSTTSILRTPVIDSIGIEYREDEIFTGEGNYAQFYARDFVGLGDTYWIKTYRNGAYLNKAQELNIAYDAGFDAGTGIDALIFIPPIRELVNPLNEDLLPSPYDVGDEIRVEIHSISNEAFNFLEIARDQINNGDNGIFALPLANTRTNVIASDGSLVLGFFNIAGVSSLSRVVTE